MVTKKYFLNILTIFLFSFQFSSSIFSMDVSPGCCYASMVVDRGCGPEQVPVGDLLKITNSVEYPLQVSIKAGGQFVETEGGRTRRGSQEGTEVLFFGVLNPGQEIFVDRNKFTALTFRIWRNNPAACFNSGADRLQAADKRRKSNCVYAGFP